MPSESPKSVERPKTPLVPEVTLASLPSLTRELADSIRATGFVPDAVVYVERGARLMASELCDHFKCRAISVTTRRKGGRLKTLAAPLIAHLPTGVRNILRKLDEWFFWKKHTSGPRPVETTFSGSLSGRQILLVDDAADSGGTIAGCRAWLADRGVGAGNVRVAVLCATTPTGRSYADFWIFERNTRLPWSSDSPERTEAEILWRENPPPAYASRDL